MLREKAQPKIIINLCLALIMLSTSFIYSANRLTNSLLECKFLTLTTQYFLLSVFSWSLVEGFHTSRGVIFPLKVKVDNYLCKMFIFAWGKFYLQSGGIEV